MRLRSPLLPLLLVLTSVGFSQKLKVGDTLPGPLALEGFSQTDATSFEDYAGRAVLVEFFAYW